MRTYARISDGVVLEIISLAETVSVEETFHSDVAATMIECGPDVAVGWTHDGEFHPSETVEGSLLDKAKLARIVDLTASCAAAIVGGYPSSALGESHVYPSGITDQINMMGSVTASLLPDLSPDWITPFWCADTEGNWAFRPHTQAQIQEAGSDGKAHVVSCQATLESLSAQVMAAGNVEDVEAINWPDPA